MELYSIFKYQIPLSLLPLVPKRKIRQSEQQREECKKTGSLLFRNNPVLFVVTSSGETSNFLIEDLERVLQLETLEFTK
jgi:hypothetical protein